MNKVILIGRLTRDPEVRYSQGAQPLAIAKYSLAVDRKNKQEGQPTTDFINCVALGRNGEFAEKYLRKGIKIAITGRIQTGSYTHKEAGIKISTFDVVVEEHEFCESKNASGSTDGGYTGGNSRPATSSAGDGFMNIPDGIDDSELPFN